MRPHLFSPIAHAPNRVQQPLNRHLPCFSLNNISHKESVDQSRGYQSSVKARFGVHDMHGRNDPNMVAFIKYIITDAHMHIYMICMVPCQHPCLYGNLL